MIYSASESDANMLWATRFFAPDPFIFIVKRGKRYLIMNDLEIDRAKGQASVDRVLSYSEYQKRRQNRGSRTKFCSYANRSDASSSKPTSMNPNATAPSTEASVEGAVA